MARPSHETLGELRVPVSAHDDQVSVKAVCGVDEPLTNGLSKAVLIANGNAEPMAREVRCDVQSGCFAMLLASYLGIDSGDADFCRWC